MKVIEYIKDKFLAILICLFSCFVIDGLLYIFNVKEEVIILVTIVFLTNSFVVFLHEFYKKKVFYNFLYKNLNNLDKKYLIAEIIKSPNFSEGKILCDCLYDINKSFIEELNNYKYSSEELKEYIELWCHEIKTPIATSKLILENNKSKTNNSLLEELNKVDSYIEQVLFYSKSKNPEKDYIITTLNLKDEINNVIKRNKKDLISNKIKIDILVEDTFIKSDSKWLEFIINQIVTNSIKYKNKESYIRFKSITNKNNVILSIEDNGIGIKEEEIKRVFDKGFTGTNGRINKKSTGIGLYLCKKLCDKLGYSINISSIENKKTIVSIIFPKSSMY